MLMILDIGKAQLIIRFLLCNLYSVFILQFHGKKNKINLQNYSIIILIIIKFILSLMLLTNLYKKPNLDNNLAPLTTSNLILTIRCHQPLKPKQFKISLATQGELVY